MDKTETKSEEAKTTEKTVEEQIASTIKEIKAEIEKGKEDALTTEKVTNLFNDLYEKRKSLETPFVIKTEEDKDEKLGMLIKAFYKGYTTKDYKPFFELRKKIATATKAMDPDTGSAGGYLIPDELMGALILPVQEDGNIEALGTVFNGVARTGHFNRVTAGLTVGRTSAGASISGSQPTFAQESWAMSKGLKGLVAIPSELTEWSNVAVTNYIRQQFQIDLMKAQWAEFILGTGTDEAKGLDAYTITAIAQAGSTLAVGDLIKANIELATYFLGGARWFMRKDVYAYIMGLADSTGKPLFLADLLNQTANKRTLLGAPVSLNDNIPNNLGAGTDESEIYFGDPKGYFKFHPKSGLRIDISKDFYFDTDDLAVRLVLQDDGRLGRTDSFVKITGVKLA